MCSARELGLTLGTARPTHHEERGARCVEPGERFDREVDALERLDAPDEQEHGMGVEPQRAARLGLVARREEGGVDTLRDDDDPFGIGAVIADQLVTFLVGRRHHEIGTAHHFGLDARSQVTSSSSPTGRTRSSEWNVVTSGRSSSCFSR